MTLVEKNLMYRNKIEYRNFPGYPNHVVASNYFNKPDNIIRTEPGKKGYDYSLYRKVTRAGGGGNFADPRYPK